MPGAVPVITGVVVLAVLSWDVLRTVFAVGLGSGPLTRGGNRLLAVVMRRLSHRARVWAGPVAAAAATPAWLGLLWLGWGLVFQPAGSVVDSQNGQPVGDWEQVYFAGYSLVTLGNGEYRPSGALWQALTVVAAGSGFLVFTLGLGYVVSVLGAAAQQNAVGARVYAVGRSASDVVLAAWDGQRLHGIDDDLRDLNTAITEVAQHYLAYPVLRVFHSAAREDALIPGVVVLDEALTLLECAVPAGLGPHRPVVAQTRSAVDRFLAVAPVPASGTAVPRRPDVGLLRDAGVPVVEEKALREALDRFAERRGRLSSLLVGGGWSWDDVDPRP